MSTATFNFPSHLSLPEPELLFHGKKTHLHPLMGLIEYGPYGLKLGVPAKVRFALLAPRLHRGKLEALVKELTRSAKPREATNYYPEYPGFEKLFRVPLRDVDPKEVAPKN